MYATKGVKTMKNVFDITPQQIQPQKKKRVAAYARVSSGKDAMLHSLKAQIDYYHDYINRNPEWTFAGIYADEAKTGTKDSREQFQLLLEDCRAGKIDMVVTKAISRFARNTVTLLETVRELQRLGIDVYFEEQNIYTLSADGELMLTLLASFAQEESLSASENQKWRIRKGFEQGKASTCNMLGYRLVDGEITIVPDEAEIVRRIFELYHSGYGMQKIANILNDEGYRTVKGSEWRVSKVRSVLQNEKYAGDLLLQKVFVRDHVSKACVPNRGELPQYYVEDDHEAIVDKEVFEAVQTLMAQRRNEYPRSQGHESAFSRKIQCAICGKNYRRKVTAYNVVWCCSTFNTKGKKYCASKVIPEATLQTATAEVLGMNHFDEEVFKCQIDHIEACPDNLLRFVFVSGAVQEYRWKDRSRRDSWTTEMRETARQKALERSRADG